MSYPHIGNALTLTRMDANNLSAVWMRDLALDKRHGEPLRRMLNDLRHEQATHAKTS